MSKVRRKDLKDHIGKPGPHPVLHCDECGEDFSANAGDYYDLPQEHVFRCCDRHMRLAIKTVVYVDCEV